MATTNRPMVDLTGGEAALPGCPCSADDFTATHGRPAADRPPDRPPVAGAPPALPEASGRGRGGPVVGPLPDLQRIYDPGLEPDRLSAAQREWFGRHRLRRTNPWRVIGLHFLTLGVATVVHFGGMHGRLPRLRADDWTAGKAAGFLLIPIFNLFWFVRFWLRLIDRLNFQYRVRGRPIPLSKAEPAAAILALYAGVAFPAAALVSFGILFPAVIWRVQAACNRLAGEGA